MPRFKRLLLISHPQTQLNSSKQRLEFNPAIFKASVFLVFPYPLVQSTAYQVALTLFAFLNSKSGIDSQQRRFKAWVQNSKKSPVPELGAQFLTHNVSKEAKLGPEGSDLSTHCF